MSFRRVLTAVALVVVSIVLVGQVRKLLADPTIWPPDDFIEYWAAAKLTLGGQNPYDPQLLLPLQQGNGRQTDQAVMMWNPPWTLPFVLPLGLLPVREAQLLWLLVNSVAMIFCGDRLWLSLGGARERRGIGWAIALAALPTAFALQSGQIGPLLLLGAVLFLECERRGYHMAAGAATVLLAIKPHLAYLVWVAILCDAVLRRRRRIILGGAIAGLICGAMPLVFNSQVWHQYLDAMTNRPPEQWISPTLGTVLRLIFGEEMFRLQFIPLAAGLAWFAWHWMKCRNNWKWHEQLPLVLLVSFVTAPYGAWPFDMVLLLPAVTMVFVTWDHQRLGDRGQKLASSESIARLRLAIAGLIVVNLGCLAMNLMKITSFWFIWVSPVVLLLYAIGMSRRNANPAANRTSHLSLQEAVAV